MIGRLAGPADPFEGRGAQRQAARLRVKGLVALAMSVVACCLTAAAWAVALAPLVGLAPR